MTVRSPGPYVYIPPGFPHGLDDASLGKLTDDIAGSLISDAAGHDLRGVAYWGVLLELAHGERHRRWMVSANEQATRSLAFSRWALVLVFASLLISTGIGIANLIIAR